MILFKYFGQSLFSSFFQLLYVWASGFSAAFLKKNRVAARGVINANEIDTNALVDRKAVLQLGSPNLQLPNYVIPLMIQIILGSK